MLDNANEAILKNPASDKKVELYLSDEGDDIVLEVVVVTSYMNQNSDAIVVEENEPFGTRFSIFIPKSEGRNENS